MRPALADFRIESEAVIRLSFADGKTYRVNPNDLERYVGREDLTAIQRALRLRKQFIRRVLPISLMVFLAASIIGLASHDAQRIQAMLHPSLPTTHTAKSVHTLPVSSQAKQPVSAAAAGQSSAAAGGSTAGAARSTTATTANSFKSSAAAVTSQPAKATPTTSQSVPAPVATTAKPVIQQVLNPVTQTAKTVLGKLLP